MKINKDTIDESGRVGYALVLLESSGYVDPWEEEISERICNGTPDEIELIIDDLLMNQVDRWSGFRNKDINRRLDKKC